MKKSSFKTDAQLACPKCNYVQKVEMPLNACQHFYKCKNCDTMLKPKTKDCCVFCSYANFLCPPKQRELNINL